MKHTVITQKIDGYKIVIGFDIVHPDQEATKKAIKEIVLQSPETQAIIDKQLEIKPVIDARDQCWKDAKEAWRVGNKTKQAKHEYEADQKQLVIDELNQEMVHILKNYKERQRSEWQKHVVYFEPKAGEIRLTDEEYETYLQEYIEARRNNNLLDIDHNVIIDNRGVQYIKKGKICVVDVLGEQPDGPLLKDVTPEQFEIMRIENMTKKEKDDELATIIDGLAGQAAMMKNKLEIQGDAQALLKSQEWYNTEVAKVTEKYS